MRFSFLDGFRALAVTLIVVQHSITSAVMKVFASIGLAPAGYLFSTLTQSGVELFFVLSGVVLLRPYLRNEKKFDVVHYAKRRFIRIYPPYFAAVLFASFVILLNTMFPTWYSAILGKFGLYTFAKQFFIFNQSWDYYNLAWWSLQIEILFYILVPIILVVITRTKFKMQITIHYAVILLVSVVMQQIFARSFPDHYSLTVVYSNLYRFVDYIPCFYLGVCLALMDINKRDRIIAVLLGTVLLASSFFYSPASHMGYAFLYFALVAWAFQSIAVANWFSGENWIWVGERSYSIFLVHFSVFYLTNYIVSYFVDDRSFIYGALSRGLGIPFALGISMVLFWFVERRFASGLSTDHQFLPPFISNSIENVFGLKRQPNEIKR